MRKSVLLALPLILSACYSPPKRMDAGAALNIAPTKVSYQSIRLGLMLSESANETYSYLKSINESTKLGFSQKARVDPDVVMGGITATLNKHFGTVRRLSSFEQMGGSDAPNMVMVLAMYANIASSSLGKDRFEFGGIFADPERNEIARLKGKVEKRVGFPVTIRKTKGLPGEALAQLDSAIASSQDLFDYDRRLQKTAPRQVPAAIPANGEPGLAVELRPTYSSPSSENDVAIVIGVESYSNLPKADYAQRDAAAVTRHLAALGVPRRNVVHLEGSKAGFSSFKKYLEAWLPKNVKPESRVYFYFSGHGAPDVESGEAYLLPWDGDPSFLKETAYPLKRLYARLSALGVREVVVALDACFSGAGGRSVLAKGVRPLVTRVDAAESSAGTITLLTAASGSQITATLEPQGHGIFTYFLLKGLNGAAKDASGRVTSRSLYDYLKPHVRDEARRQNREQIPGYRSGSDIVLRR
jgi:hypothetical protein